MDEDQDVPYRPGTEWLRRGIVALPVGLLMLAFAGRSEMVVMLGGVVTLFGLFALGRGLWDRVA